MMALMASLAAIVAKVNGEIASWENEVAERRKVRDAILRSAAGETT